MFERSITHDSSSNDTNGKRRPLPVRKTRRDFGGVPADWHNGSLLLSAIADGVNLLFPHGERFFVRSVRAFEDAIESPELKAQLRGFYGQEGAHAREHERYFTILRERGVPIDDFLRRFDATIRFAERNVPAVWSLAATAAADHYTAIMAHYALSTGDLDGAHPEMRDLLKWHAAEEIEHKAVAFDVLQEIDPSLRTRVIGLVIATAFLFPAWVVGTGLVLRSEGATVEGLREDARVLGERRGSLHILRDVLMAGWRSYVKRDFHPWDEDDLHMADEVFEALKQAS